MAYYVYILYSKELQQYYVGITSRHNKRYKQHLRGQSQWTSRTKEWVRVSKERSETMAEARALEKQIKACGARRYLERQRASQSRLGAGQVTLHA